MVLTRAQSAAAYAEVCTKFLEATGTTYVKSALDAYGITGIEDLLQLPFGDLALLSYQPPDVGDERQDLVVLNQGTQNCIAQFIEWINKVQTTGNVVLDTPDKWTALLEDDFNTYRTSAGNNPAIRQARGNNGMPNVVANNAQQVRVEVDNFKRGNKRDPNVFTKLRDEKSWDV